MSSDPKWHEHISNICLKATRILNFVRRNTYCCSREAKNLAYLSLVRPNLEYAAAAWDPYMAKDIQQLERVQRRAARFVKKDYRHTLLSLVCSTNLVGCPCSNVANTLVWWFSTRRLITFQPFLWITFQFHHGILEPPMKTNLCHCQFVLMLSNIHFFLRPLLWRGSEGDRGSYGGDSTLTPPTGNVALVTDDLVVSLRSGIWLEVEDSSLGSGITRLPRRYPCWPRVAISSWQDWSWFAEHDVYLIIEGLI